MSKAFLEATETERSLAQWWVGLLTPRIPQPLSEWAEANIVLPPPGPLQGRQFSLAVHPVCRHWFEALQSGRWQRYALSGPGQDGKSLQGFVIPTVHKLFEHKETVFVGIPDMKLANEKWLVDFLPTIETSFPDMLPIRGEGSRGGAVKSAVTFRNGARLKFLSAGQGDAGLAGPTTRNLVMTEVDKYDTAGEASREADPVAQMEARTNAFRDYGRQVILECTVSIAAGRIWQEITRGTDSRLMQPCPHCGVHVAWEREQLKGWEDAEDEFAARDAAFWECPHCQGTINDATRRTMWARTLLVHRGQEVTPEGTIVGPEPRTETFGLRWSAFCSPFKSTGRLGQDEWRAKRAVNRESAEKERRQFFWCVPWEPPEVELTPLTAEDVQKRMGGLRKGILPDDSLGVAVGVDTGKRALHWQAVAIRPTGSAHVIEYGVQPTEADSVGVTRGLIDALNRLYAYFASAWQPRQVWIDSGWHEHQEAVYEFCRQVATAAGLQSGQEIYRPTKGHGERQRGTTRYIAPRAKGGDIRYLGQEYHLSYQRPAQLNLVHVNSDHWKSNLHQRLAMSADEPGALTLYEAASPREHDEYSQHITAEIQKEQWIDGRGEVIVWERVRRNNHWLDAGYLSLAAGHFIAAEIERQKSTPKEGWFERQRKQRRA